LLSRAAAALDRSAIRLVERRWAPRPDRSDPRAPATTALRAPPTPREHRADALRASRLAAAYGDGTRAIPSPFFPAPEAAAPRVAPGPAGPLGARTADLAWESTYTPFLAEAREPLARARANGTAYARWWSIAPAGAARAGAARPAIVLLHGWGASPYWITERALGVSEWLRHGFDVAALILPHHGPRAEPPAEARGAGAPRWPSGSIAVTNEGFGQAIYDARALARLLRARGAGAVGALGMSLGGYTAALWASVAGPADEGGLDFAIALAPVATLAGLVWRLGSPPAARRAAAGAGAAEERIAEALAVHAPTARPVRVPRAGLAVVGGRGDRIAPPEHARAIAQHWGVAPRWFAGGHLAQVGRAAALDAVRAQLAAIGLPGGPEVRA
jgi:hypothetical protein